MWTYLLLEITILIFIYIFLSKKQNGASLLEDRRGNITELGVIYGVVNMTYIIANLIIIFHEHKTITQLLNPYLI